MDAAPELMTFTPGLVLTFVPEKKMSHMPDSVTVAEVIDHGRVLQGVSHRYSIKTTDGEGYSGWWFDAAAPDVWDDGDYWDDHTMDHQDC